MWILNIVLFSSILSVEATVEIQIEKSLYEMGKDLTLLCKIENCCSSEHKSWRGGPGNRLLMLNSGKSTDKNKYMTKIQKDGLVLIIKNLSENDFNVKYECSIGFDKVDLNLTYEAVFNQAELNFTYSTEMPGPREEQSSPDSGKSETVVAIIGGCIGVLVLVIVAAVIFICIRKRRNRRIPPNGDEDPDETFVQEYTLLNSSTNPDTATDPDKTFVQECTPLNSSTNPDTATGHLSESPSSGYSTIQVVTADGSPTSSNEEVHSTECKSASAVTCTELHPDSMLNPSAESISSFPSLSLPVNRDTRVREERPRIERGFQFTQKNESKRSHARTKNKHPEYKDFDLRKMTFENSLWLMSPSVEQMANAGFFFAGSGHVARCFCCNAVREWHEGDNPLDDVYHKQCEYIKKMKNNDENKT